MSLVTGNREWFNETHVQKTPKLARSHRREKRLWLRHVRLSVRLTACIRAAPTGQISMKFDI
jgi:hypothetical protein